MALLWVSQCAGSLVLPFFGKQNADPFSNHARVPTTYRGTRYPTSEHAYLATQARHYGMRELAEVWTRGLGRHYAFGRWFDASNPKDVKTWSTKAFRPLRNNPNNPLRKTWMEKRAQLMFGICLAKFSGDERARRLLLETGHQYLVENSPYDAEWGIGQSLTTRELTDALYEKRPGLGRNQLGRILMAVRNTLRRKDPPRKALKQRTLRYLARKETLRQKQAKQFRKYTTQQTEAIMRHFPRQLIPSTRKLVDSTNKPRKIVAGAHVFAVQRNKQ